MYKVIYLPTAEEVKLPNDFYSEDKYKLLEFILINDCYKYNNGSFKFLTYDEFIGLGVDYYFMRPIPRYLLEIIEVK